MYSWVLCHSYQYHYWRRCSRQHQEKRKQKKWPDGGKKRYSTSTQVKLYRKWTWDFQSKISCDWWYLYLIIKTKYPRFTEKLLKFYKDLLWCSVIQPTHKSWYLKLTNIAVLDQLPIFFNIWKASVCQHKNVWHFSSLPLDVISIFCKLTQSLLSSDCNLIAKNHFLFFESMLWLTWMLT